MDRYYNKLLLLCILTLTPVIWCQTPIPHRPEGHVYLGATGGNPKVVVEAFYDHLCDDSLANWPTLQMLKQEYSSSSDIEILIHIFPLPYHHNAYFVQEAGVVVRSSSEDKFEGFVDTIFKNQEKFLTGAVNMTEPQVKSAIAELVEKELGIKKDDVMKGYDDETIVRRSRYAWKYAAHRGITGTPMFIVNGVHYPDGGDNKIDDWKSMITELVKDP